MKPLPFALWGDLSELPPVRIDVGDAEEGVPTRAIAEALGQGRDVPVASVPPE